MDDLLTRAQLVEYDPGTGRDRHRHSPGRICRHGSTWGVPRHFAPRARPGRGGRWRWPGAREGRGRLGQGNSQGAAGLHGGREIALWFDEHELARAFDDFEAHGLRERAAVLAVAATAAANERVAGAGEDSACQAGGQRRAADPADLGGAGSEHSRWRRPVHGHPEGRAAEPADLRGADSEPQRRTPSVTSTGDSGLSAGELAAVLGAGAILISAAGFGVARKHTPPVSPA